MTARTATSLLARTGISLLLALSCQAQSLFFGLNKTTGAPPVGGTISSVSGQPKGQTSCQATRPNMALTNALTAGNDIIIGTIAYDTASSVTHITPSQNAGTASLGAFTEDKTFSANSAG